MDNFHIYEEAGKGKFSVVYKGRKKGTIEYVAIKSVKKAQLETIMHEVKIQYRLKHPNILQFHNWYETSNHIWTILEWCAGPSLRNIIEQDGRLPEASIRLFAADMLGGLHYLHTHGQIYGDLKPATVLMDEYGVLKLASFSLSRPVPPEPPPASADVAGGDAAAAAAAAAASQQAAGVPGGVRGSPHYMAPELFHRRRGFHSYESDFWALGIGMSVITVRVSVPSPSRPFAL